MASSCGAVALGKVVSAGVAASRWRYGLCGRGGVPCSGWALATIGLKGLFRRQDIGYRHSVITPGIPVFCLTAGLPVTMLGFAGSDGKVFGLETFGFSAAYGILDQNFGFTGENIANEVINFLKA